MALLKVKSWSDYPENQYPVVVTGWTDSEDLIVQSKIFRAQTYLDV